MHILEKKGLMGWNLIDRMMGVHTWHLALFYSWGDKICWFYDFMILWFSPLLLFFAGLARDTPLFSYFLDSFAGGIPCYCIFRCCEVGVWGVFGRSWELNISGLRIPIFVCWFIGCVLMKWCLCKLWQWGVFHSLIFLSSKVNHWGEPFGACFHFFFIGRCGLAIICRHRNWE